MINKIKKNQFFWDVVYRFSFFTPDFLFKKIPKEIIIEPTNSCNLRCPVCPTHFAMKRQRGFMELDLFKKIIDEFRSQKEKPRIFMNFSGEPLLNKNLDKFVSYAAQNGHKTFISTNVTLLDKDFSEKLIDAGLNSIHLCIDGATKEAQESYRVGSNFEVVKKNIEDFLKIRKNKNKYDLHASIQVLLTSYSESQIDKVKEWAKKSGADSVNFKTLSMGSYTTDEIKKKYNYLLPTKKEFRRKTSNIKKTLCSVPMSQALVYWNGDLGLCCVDFDNVVRMPNISEEGFLKTYFSEEVIKKRKSAFRKQLKLCKQCSLGNADFMGMNINFKKDENF